MKKLAYIFSLVSCLFLGRVEAQQKMDGKISFNQEVRSYSIYIPESYNDAFPNPMVFAIHPLDQSLSPRQFRDRLKKFAEKNGVILVCPEVANGEGEKPFLEFMLQKSLEWMEVDINRIYSLNPSSMDLSEFPSIRGQVQYAFNTPDHELVGKALKNLDEQPKVFISGVDAWVDSVPEHIQAHYIRNSNAFFQFQSRDRVLSEALSFLEIKNIIEKSDAYQASPYAPSKSNKPQQRPSGASSPGWESQLPEVDMTSIRWYADPYYRGEWLDFHTELEIKRVSIYNSSGRLIKTLDKGEKKVATSGWRPGSYIMRVLTNKGMETHIVLVL